MFAGLLAVERNVAKYMFQGTAELAYLYETQFEREEDTRAYKNGNEAPGSPKYGIDVGDYLGQLFHGEKTLMVKKEKTATLPSLIILEKSA